MGEKKKPGVEPGLPEPGIPDAPEYGKAAILRSQRYAGRRDLLEAILDPGKTYTFEAVDAAIDLFMKARD
jgi:hypothetical protein